MKNTYKIFSGLFVLSVLFTSCTSEEETNELSALEKELTLENNGILTVESTTYIFKTAGETSKFVKKEKAFDFTYSDELSYKASGSASKHEGEDLIITNPDSEEFIRLYHFEELKNNKVQFDVEFSNGKKLFSVVYNSKSPLVSESGKCHDFPCRNVDENVIESLIEISQDDAIVPCKDLVAACVTAGGNPSIVIHRGGNGWFIPAESCVVECK